MSPDEAENYIRPEDEEFERKRQWLIKSAEATGFTFGQAMFIVDNFYSKLLSRDEDTK